MLNKYVVCIDPGLATGWSAWRRTSPDSAYSRAAYGVVSGGIKGIGNSDLYTYLSFADVVVCELFKRDSRTNNPDLSALYIEGYLQGLREERDTDGRFSFELEWQLNRSKATEVQDPILKEKGLWLTGGDVQWKDGRDANDSQLHFLSYIKRVKHGPSIRKYFL